MQRQEAPMGDIAVDVSRGGWIGPEELGAKQNARAENQRQTGFTASDEPVANRVEHEQAANQPQECERRLPGIAGDLAQVEQRQIEVGGQERHPQRPQRIQQGRRDRRGQESHWN
ncbi:MAG: hypothetical protein LC797_02865 [Chloroflexi bacterium]|nr:hypothetical protein [Chloroflexota bacterium]